ncbi:MAG: hypothetical protein JHC33_02805 [Ignisphaera sp.]|jgi:hypothetical protein|nr:hypothetical protein [Ignisphaera sp.]
MANSFIGGASVTIKNGGTKPATTVVYGGSDNNNSKNTCDTSKNTCNVTTGDFRKDVTEELRKQFRLD